MRFLRGMTMFICVCWAFSFMILGVATAVFFNQPECCPKFNYGMLGSFLILAAICFSVLTPIIMMTVFGKTILLREADYQKAVQAHYSEKNRYEYLIHTYANLIEKLTEKAQKDGKDKD